MYDVNRIEMLRAGAVEPRVDYQEFYLHFYRAFMKNGSMHYMQRYADAIYESFDKTETVIADGELLVGRPPERIFTPEEEAEWTLIKQYGVGAAPASFGQDSHMTVDYEKLLWKGTSGIRKEIEDLKRGLDLTFPDQLEKYEYYNACIRCLEGVERFSDRYAAHAERLAGVCKDPARKEELLRIADTCMRVPKHPAKGFYEAVQSVHFLTLCLSNKPLRRSMLQYQLGRPDRYLLPFYEKDIKEGNISEDEAQTILDLLAIQINRRVCRGLSSGYMVGGRDENGNVVSNPLTRMLMKAVEDVRLVYPSVGLCVCKDTPEEDLTLAIEILGKGHSHPALFNDEVISRGLKAMGLADKEAANYIHSTCVEITPIAASNVWVASPYMNMVQMLLDVIGQREYASMMELTNAYLAHVSEGIRQNLIKAQMDRMDRRRYDFDPLLSCFVNDCLKTGTDIERGGAKYNWIMPSFVGLSNAADALYAIEELVFNKKEWTIAAFLEMLKADFKGYEAERKKILSVPKYGNNLDAPDGYAELITKWLSMECAKYNMPDGFRLVPSLFCWVMHDHFGQETGASPDGRLAGFPLGDGSGPAQGREENGPTSAILSCTKWDHMPFTGGIAMNMKFGKRFFSEETAEKLKALVYVYMERGGFELQINVVDRDTLLKAQKTPELYKDLVVRIGGYSDYFTKLSPTMQAEILLRTEYEM